MSGPRQHEKLQKSILAVTGNQRSILKTERLLPDLESIHISRLQSAIVKALHVHAKQEGKIRPRTIGPWRNSGGSGFSQEAVCQNIKIEAIYTIGWKTLTAKDTLDNRISDYKHWAGYPMRVL